MVIGRIILAGGVLCKGGISMLRGGQARDYTSAVFRGQARSYAARSFRGTPPL